MMVACVFSSTVMLMRGGYCRLKNLTHRNSQTLAALVIGGGGYTERTCEGEGTL